MTKRTGEGSSPDLLVPAGGGAAGGVVGWWAADEVTDLVWDFTYEQVTG